MTLSNQSQRFIIHGELASPSFLPWMERHSARLGLSCAPIHTGDVRVEVRVEGQTDLIDAFEVGCLLGPYDVWVERIERHPERVGT